MRNGTFKQQNYRSLSIYTRRLIDLKRTETLETPTQQENHHSIFIRYNSVYDVMQTPELTHLTQITNHSSALEYALTFRAYAVALYLMHQTDTVPQEQQGPASLLESALEYIVLAHSPNDINDKSQLEQALLCFEVLVSKGLDPLDTQKAPQYFKMDSLEQYVNRSINACDPNNIEQTQQVPQSRKACLETLHKHIEKAKAPDYQFDFDAYLSAYPQPDLTQLTDEHRAEAEQFLARLIPERPALAAHNRNALPQRLSLATEDKTKRTNPFTKEDSDWEKPNIPAVTALTNASGPGLMRSSSPSMEDWEIVDAPSKSTSPILGD